MSCLALSSMPGTSVLFHAETPSGIRIHMSPPPPTPLCVTDAQRGRIRRRGGMRQGPVCWRHHRSGQVGHWRRRRVADGAARSHEPRDEAADAPDDLQRDEDNVRRRGDQGEGGWETDGGEAVPPAWRCGGRGATGTRRSRRLLVSVVLGVGGQTAAESLFNKVQIPHASQHRRRGINHHVTRTPNLSPPPLGSLIGERMPAPASL